MSSMQIPVRFIHSDTTLEDNYKILVTTFEEWDGSNTYFLRRGTNDDYSVIREWYVEKTSGDGPIWAVFCRVENFPEDYVYLSSFFSPKPFSVYLYNIRESDGKLTEYYYDASELSYNGCTLYQYDHAWGDYNIQYTYENLSTMDYEGETNRTDLLCEYLFGPVDE